jgi:pterin-4a-carbinolamine dehydratase
MTSRLQVLTGEQVQHELARRLPSWEAAENAVRRVYRTSGWKASVLAANAIAHLAEVAWHHPELVVAWGSVTVILTTHSEGGVTEKDLVLAERIEQSMGWRPAGEGGLEGTPDDPRYAYLARD